MPTTMSQPDVQQALARRVEELHPMLAAWLAMPGISLACGRWSEGVIAEFVPADGARLLAGRYDGIFVGVREIRLPCAEHHVHIDLGRVERLCFTLAPSVCLGFKPSFEVRLLTRGRNGTVSGDWLLSLMLAAPYDGELLDPDAARQFLAQACTQMRQYPATTEFVLDEQVRRTPAGAAILPMLQELSGSSSPEWDDVLRALRPPSQGALLVGDPVALPLLRRALTLREAALVIHREQVLVEFQTEDLDGVHRYEEHGHVSWQIGAQEAHHCHLRVEAVDHVIFSAQPSPCMGGAINFTVWFNTSRPSGNPFRANGYFSITLNRPYADGYARVDVIDPVLDLYRAFQAEAWVTADDGFLRALTENPPVRSSNHRANLWETQSVNCVDQRSR